MKFAKWLFVVAGVYGVLVLAPLYFQEGLIAREFPPAITHPEYFYGFIGVALAWQVLFFLLSRDPLRYRLLILPAILEKLGYGGAVLVLFVTGRASGLVLGFGLIDLTFVALFALAFYRLGQSPGTSSR